LGSLVNSPRRFRMSSELGDFADPVVLAYEHLEHLTKPV